MYERYWKLLRPAFRSEAPGDFFFTGRGQHAALLKLRFLVEQRQGAGMLIGAPGVGKSALLDAFRMQLPAQFGPVVSILFPQLTPLELIGDIAARLGVGEAALDRPSLRTDGLLRLLEARLQQLTRDGRHPILLIDDAELIEDRRVFQTLQLLLNFRQPEQLDFTLILCGQPELAGQVQRQSPLCDRLALTCVVHPLEADETAAYVQHRLQAAGTSASIFDAEALAQLHRLSGGLPRRINRLCDFALLVGYADSLEQIGATQIEAVAEEICAIAA